MNTRLLMTAAIAANYNATAYHRRWTDAAARADLGAAFYYTESPDFG